MKLKPLKDYMLVKPIKAEQTTSAGIHLPDGVAESEGMLVIAEVLAIGPGPQLESGEYMDLGIEKGQFVVFSAATPIFPIKNSAIAKLNNEPQMPDVVMMHAAHVMALLDTTEGEMMLEAAGSSLC